MELSSLVPPPSCTGLLQSSLIPFFFFNNLNLIFLICVSCKFHFLVILFSDLLLCAILLNRSTTEFYPGPPGDVSGRGVCGVCFAYLAEDGLAVAHSRRLVTGAEKQGGGCVDKVGLELSVDEEEVVHHKGLQKLQRGHAVRCEDETRADGRVPIFLNLIRMVSGVRRTVEKMKSPRWRTTIG